MIECQSIGRLRSSTMMVMITTIMQSEKAPTRTVVVLCSSIVLLLAHTKRNRSAADRFPNGLAYDVDDEARRGNNRRVVYRMRLHPGVHPLRHKALRVLDDHAVLLRH